MKKKNILHIIIQASLLIYFTGCSAIAGVMPGGSNSQVLESKIPRAEASAPAGNDLDQLTAGNRAFAMDLYHRLETREGNLFYSPFSISSALAMTYAGAEGKTAEEMANVFHFLMEEDRLHPAFNALDQYLESLANQEIPEDMGEAFGVLMESAAALDTVQVAVGIY